MSKLNLKVEEQFETKEILVGYLTSLIDRIENDEEVEEVQQDKLSYRIVNDTSGEARPDRSFAFGVTLIADMGRNGSIDVEDMDISDIAEYLQDKDSESEGRIESVPCRYDAYYIFPLYAYIHSGIKLSTSISDYPFTCKWDTSNVGFVLVDKHFSEKDVTLEDAGRMAEGMVDTWNMWLSGDVWGYVIEDSFENTIDSCYGFYGYDNCVEEAEKMIEHLNKNGW